MADAGVILGVTESLAEISEFKKLVKLEENDDGTYSLCVSTKTDNSSTGMVAAINNLITNIDTLNTNINTLITAQNTTNTNLVTINNSLLDLDVTVINSSLDVNVLGGGI